MPAPLNVTLSFSSDEAWALAQFVKRADRDTARRHAGDAQEADLIFDAWQTTGSPFAVTLTNVPATVTGGAGLEAHWAELSEARAAYLSAGA